METNESVYAGLWGLHLSGELDLGEGVTLHPTYVHVMTNTMLAFCRPERPGTHHPAPWKATSEMYSYDVEAQLCVPATYTRKASRLEVVKSIVALLRLYVHPDIRFALAASRPFTELSGTSELIVADQLEIHPRHFDFGSIPIEGNESRVDWVKQHWQTALDLMENSHEFKLALDVYLSGQFIPNPSMVMVAVWGALEALFVGTKNELRFRVSALLATYMEPRGKTRTAFQRKAGKLYDARSSVAHGSSKHEHKDLIESFLLLRDVLIKIIGAGKVPSKAGLEAKLFED